jgi:aryl-alcohol dehydrogenase-like predicted oxidoreductase
VEQPPYNMMNRHIEQEIMPTCAKHGIGITVFSPLAQGLLTGKYNDGIPAGSRATRSDGLRGTLTDENIAKVQRLTALAADLELEMSQLALAWILRRPEISAVITGATRPEHVLSNVKAAGVRLTSNVLEEIEAILDNAPA